MQHSEPSGPYLVIPAVYRKEPVRYRLPWRQGWKKVAIAVLAGGFAGGLFALRQTAPTMSAPVVRLKVPSAKPPVDADEFARLEERNRRLEALVWTLRHRDKPATRAPQQSVR